MARPISQRELLAAKLEHERCIELITGRQDRFMSQSMLMQQAARAARAEQAKAHIEYRRSLERAHSTTLLVGKKEIRTIKMRKKPGAMDDNR